MQHESGSRNPVTTPTSDTAAVNAIADNGGNHGVVLGEVVMEVVKEKIQVLYGTEESPQNTQTMNSINIEVSAKETVASVMQELMEDEEGVKDAQQGD